MGRLTSDTVPRITVTMAITMATIGRRIKNFDISYLPAALVAEATVAGAGCGADGSALAEFLQVVDDDLRARQKPRLRPASWCRSVARVATVVRWALLSSPAT